MAAESTDPTLIAMIGAILAYTAKEIYRMVQKKKEDEKKPAEDEWKKELMSVVKEGRDEARATNGRVTSLESDFKQTVSKYDERFASMKDQISDLKKH